MVVTLGQLTSIILCVMTLSSCQKTSSSPVSLLGSQPQPTLAPMLTQPLTAALAGTPIAPARQAVNTFLEGTAAAGGLPKTQGVWIQSADRLLADHQGNVPLSAASLTKVATFLAALQTLGPAYRFITKVGITGSIQNGVLNGDLVVQGGQDPFFVWEDAIALANRLTQSGIRQINGNLIVSGPFYMNFETEAKTAGTALKQALDAELWTKEALAQYQTLPAATPKPHLSITGEVSATAGPGVTRWVAQHRSLPLATLLKKMNRFSNNPMADMIATTIGGPQAVTQKAIAATGVASTEIQLINGSGLAVENRMSPRAVCGLFLAIDKLVQPQGLTVADIFTVVGQDQSVLDQRPLPKQSVLKSGTLDTVSALAGVLTTQKAGVVWFAILNNDGDVVAYRDLQEKLLGTLQQSLGIGVPPLALKATVPEPPLYVSQQLWTAL